LPKSWQVRGDEVEAVGQKRNEVSKHMACTGKAVQQRERRSVFAAGLAVEHLQIVDGDRAVFDGTHARCLHREITAVMEYDR
jgi:hypothetical protein